MEDLQREYVQCYLYCMSDSHASRKVLNDLRRELVNNNIHVPTAEEIEQQRPKPHKEVTAEDLLKDETFMLALIEELHFNDELWLKYRFINDSEAMMDFYNKDYKNKTAV